MRTLSICAVMALAFVMLFGCAFTHPLAESSDGKDFVKEKISTTPMEGRHYIVMGPEYGPEFAGKKRNLNKIFLAKTGINIDSVPVTLLNNAFISETVRADFGTGANRVELKELKEGSPSTTLVRATLTTGFKKLYNVRFTEKADEKIEKKETSEIRNCALVVYNEKGKIVEFFCCDATLFTNHKACAKAYSEYDGEIDDRIEKEEKFVETVEKIQNGKYVTQEEFDVLKAWVEAKLKEHGEEMNEGFSKLSLADKNFAKGMEEVTENIKDLTIDGEAKDLLLKKIQQVMGGKSLRGGPGKP